MKSNLSKKEIEKATGEICNFLNCTAKDIALSFCSREIEEIFNNWVDGDVMVAHQYGYKLERR